MEEGVKAIALLAFAPDDGVQNCLCLVEADLISIAYMQSEEQGGWFHGTSRRGSGWFPGSYVALLPQFVAQGDGALLTIHPLSPASVPTSPIPNGSVTSAVSPIAPGQALTKGVASVLCAGCEMAIKSGGDREYRRRFVYLTSDLSSIVFAKLPRGTGEIRRVDMSEVISVEKQLPRVSRRTDARQADFSDTTASIILSDGETIDIYADTGPLCDAWVAGFSLILQDNGSKQNGDDSGSQRWGWKNDADSEAGHGSNAEAGACLSPAASFLAMMSPKQRPSTSTTSTRPQRRSSGALAGLFTGLTIDENEAISGAASPTAPATHSPLRYLKRAATSVTVKKAGFGGSSHHSQGHAGHNNSGGSAASNSSSGSTSAYPKQKPTQEAIEFAEKWFSRGSSIARAFGHTSAALTVYNPHPPRHPLLATVSEEFAPAAADVYRLISEYMGDIVDKIDRAGDFEVLRLIVKSATSSPLLRAEAVCIAVKQTTMCPDRDAETYGYEVLAVLLATPPTLSSALRTVVVAHLDAAMGRSDACGGLALCARHALLSKRFNPPGSVLSRTVLDEYRKSYVPGSIFGVSLSDVAKQEYYWNTRDRIEGGLVPVPTWIFTAANVPTVLSTLIELVEALGGMSTEGVFRRSANAMRTSRLVELIREGNYAVLRQLIDRAPLLGHTDMNGAGELDSDLPDAIDAADVIKIWFRQMKEPVVHHNCYDAAVAAGKAKDPEAAHRVVASLPPLNAAVLIFVIKFLAKVASEPGTLMDPRSLATMLSPNAVKNPTDDLHVFQRNCAFETEFIRQLILTSDSFNVDTPTT